MNKDWLFTADEYICDLRTVGVLIRDGKILVQRDRNGHEYALPGGHVKIGETLEDGLIREYKEETGADIKCERFLWSEECFWTWNGKQAHNIAFYYMIELCDGNDIPDVGEFVSHKDNCNVVIGWMPIEHIQDVIIYPEFLKKEICKLDEPPKHFVSRHSVRFKTGGKIMIFRCDEFIENDINPMTNKKYDSSWIVFVLNNESYKMFCGSKNGCAYTLKVSKRYEHWEMALCDFIGYHSSIGKNIILVVSEEDYVHALKKYEGYSFNDRFLREYENEVLIHSTTKGNYKCIKKDGCLKSWNLLKNQNLCEEIEPIGAVLGDPIELRDYILFGSGTTGEIVVNSKQKGRIEMDENMEYIAGARLYFDMKKIAEDGLLVRDGGEIKVKNTLPLKPYLLWVATWDSVGLDCEVTSPKIFAQTADRYFKENILKTYEYEHLY